MYLSNLLYLLGNIFPFYYLLKHTEIKLSYTITIMLTLVCLNIITNTYKPKTLNNIVFALNILTTNIILFVSTTSNNLLELLIIFVVTLYTIYFSLTARKPQIRIYFLFVSVMLILEYFRSMPKFMSVEFLLYTSTLASILNILVYINNDIRLFQRRKNKKTKCQQTNNNKIWQFQSFFISSITL